MLERADAVKRGLTDIGGASKASGVSLKMIRHYEAIGLLPKVTRTAANYRLYREADIHTLRFIKRARALGFSIDVIQELLALWQNKSRSSTSVKKVAGQHVQALKHKIAELEAMVGTLRSVCCMRYTSDRRSSCPTSSSSRASKLATAAPKPATTAPPRACRKRTSR